MQQLGYISGLYCPKCGAEYDHNELHQLCKCGKPLLVRYDLEKVKATMTKEAIKARKPSLWRYQELLPVIKEENVVTLGEGMTPLYPAAASGKAIGIPNLLIKDEGITPTGTFKSRGAAVGVSKAKELGVEVLIMPTNGAAGAAWALFGARAGIKSVIIMPEDAPLITRNECIASGADLYIVKGLISDAGKIVARSAAANGWFDASTLKEPYRIEGKKTMGLEICEQLDWEMPDVIIYPTGGGVGLIGIYKALQELLEIGLISGKMPKLVAAQASGCDPIVKAFEQGATESQFCENSKTVAFGINVPKALGDFLVLEAIYATEGCAVAVPDDEILDGQKLLATLDGTFVCPEGACAFVAAKKLRESGFIKENDRVVVLNTGAGIKYPMPVEPNYLPLDATL